MKDHSSKIVHLTARILEATKSAIEKAEPYLKENDEQPEIAKELLIILNAADDLVEIFDPSKEAAEYFGLPRENTLGGEKPELEFKNAIGWDFNAWYCEKALSVKKGVKSTIEYWEKEISTVTLVDDSPMTPRQWVRSGLLDGLYRSQRNAKKIFDMTFDDRIEVSERND